MEECEKIIIQETLSFCKGNKTKAADILGIGRKTLLRKLDDRIEEE
jgi:DNA-binding protein Fis